MTLKLQRKTEAFRQKYVHREVYGFVDEDSALDYDDRAVRYWWKKTPEKAVTEQYRIRMKYSFETKYLLGNLTAKHLFLLCRHDIKDDVDVVRGTEAITRQIWSTAELGFSYRLNFDKFKPRVPFKCEQLDG